MRYADLSKELRAYELAWPERTARALKHGAVVVLERPSAAPLGTLRGWGCG